MTSGGGELEFQRDVDLVASQLGWRRFALPVVQKVRTPAAIKGYPDRVYFRRGRVCAFEFKAQKGGVTSAEQGEWMAEWVAVADAVCDPNRADWEQPVVAAFVRPSDYDWIVRALNG